MHYSGNTAQRTHSRDLLRWLPLVAILALAVWVRWPMLRDTGYSTTDLVTFESWTRAAVEKGLFRVYADVEPAPVDHPPIGVALLSLAANIYAMTGGSLADDNPGFRTALKVPLVVFDLLLIVAGYAIAQREMRGKIAWATAVGAALAFTPGLIADSVWWGQTDGMFSLFVVLTIYALHRRMNIATWIFYALTLLVKFQAVALLPLLVVLVWRRFGWRALAQGIAISLIVVAAVLAPFLAVSGESALRSYRESVGRYPYISIDAHNFWYWSLAFRYNLRDFGQPTDTALHVGPLPVRTVGFILFAASAGLIALRAWLLPEREDEFLLAAGLQAAFFMFSTQMHERYLYPAVVLMALAMIGSRWLWLLWAGFAMTVSQNILDPGSRDYPLWEATWRVVGWSNFQNARFNVLLTMVLILEILAPLYRFTRLPVPGQRAWRIVLITVVAALLFSEIGLRVAFAQLTPWMHDTIQDVRLTPLTDWRLSTTPLWQPDQVYGAMVQPGLSDVQVHLPDTTITVSTASLPGSRVGIRDNVLRLPLDGIALGGSDTFCLADAHDCWVDILESEQSLSLANLGQPETGSQAHLAFLRQFGSQLKPRFVLWQWSPYDLRADYRLALSQGRTAKLEPQPTSVQAACHPTLGEYSALYALICAVDRWTPDVQTARVEYGNVAMSVPINLEPLSGDRPEMRFGFEQTIEALSAAQEITHDKLQASLLMLVLPTKEEVYSNRVSPPIAPDVLDKLSRSRQSLLSTCHERGWSCLDLYPALRAQADRGEQVFYSTMPNLNPAGNRVLAQAVADMLAAQGLLSPR
jgi:Gpi18-like mannosyltransferase